MQKGVEDCLHKPLWVTALLFVDDILVMASAARVLAPTGTLGTRQGAELIGILLRYGHTTDLEASQMVCCQFLTWQYVYDRN